MTPAAYFVFIQGGKQQVQAQAVKAASVHRGYLPRAAQRSPYDQIWRFVHGWPAGCLENALVDSSSSTTAQLYTQLNQYDTCPDASSGSTANTIPLHCKSIGPSTAPAGFPLAANVALLFLLPLLALHTSPRRVGSCKSPSLGVC